MRNFTINALANELTNKGYDVKVDSVQKNGIDIPCIRINFGSYGCSLYPTSDIDAVNDGTTTVDEVVTLYAKRIEDAKLTKPIEVNRLIDKDYLKANVRLAVERDFDADYIKEPLADFAGLSKYMICMTTIGDGNGSFRITDDVVKQSGADLNEVWGWAMDNLIKDTTCKNLAEMFGFPPMPMYVISTTDLYKGASAMLNKAVLNNLAKELGTDALTIIPSSIHEIIAIPSNADDLATIATMIGQVNESEVKPEEVLFDKPFTYKVA